MTNSSDKKHPHDPLSAALDAVTEMDGEDCAVVPREPTREMMEAGAAVGKITPETARGVYLAMLWAA